MCHFEPNSNLFSRVSLNSLLARRYSSTSATVSVSMLRRRSVSSSSSSSPAINRRSQRSQERRRDLPPPSSSSGKGRYYGGDEAYSSLSSDDSLDIITADGSETVSSWENSARRCVQVSASRVIVAVGRSTSHCFRVKRYRDS